MCVVFRSFGHRTIYLPERPIRGFRGFGKRFGDRLDHVGGMEERPVIRIEQRGKSGSVLRRRREQLVVVVGFPLARPGAAAGLQQPQAADVLQQARGAVNAAFIRE